MEKTKFILWLILISFILTCAFSFRKLTFKLKEEEIFEEDTINHLVDKDFNWNAIFPIIPDDDEYVLRNYFVTYGNDSLLMFPDWLLSNLYGSTLEPYYELYKSYEEFERDILYNPKNLSVRLKWSLHSGLNKQIMKDYSHLSLNNFFKKYTVVEGHDTLLSFNDTTLAFCFDKHGYFCIFNYGNTGKNKIIWTKRTAEIEKLSSDLIDLSEFLFFDIQKSASVGEK